MVGPESVIVGETVGTTRAKAVGDPVVVDGEEVGRSVGVVVGIVVVGDRVTIVGAPV
eukprot:CAMPEP_0194035678 /NCGR_PEP_ID=MMETSP0009_2-20130614/8098_1 /TAXON_ID=210454 /ORGANISM="Grammatophora oceanica, Strain CCMP 410" /LENGTH=56 /DNA_ID=CAMNT_0038677129 /DNA_START=105 /DNA_END=271 /DNA_ORIENTATION=+